VPRYRFAETVAFYRDTLGLPVLGKDGTSESFRFGSVRLWLDCVDHQSQTDVWLELFSDDPTRPSPTSRSAASSAREEVEPLGDFPGHWVSDPAGVIFIVQRPDGDEQGTGGV
jgi:catechol 2,3-dioxygenase-like lactoylglutathione lyase family enzyme